MIFAVITGHGSDENGCGEFCVTSHHFSVNGHINNVTFSEAGTCTCFLFKDNIQCIMHAWMDECTIFSTYSENIAHL